MPNEILISDIVDLGKDERDINSLLALINKVDVAIQAVNKNPINLGNIGGLKDLKSATDQLLKATQNLNKAINDSVKTTKAASEAELKAAKIRTEEAKQTELLAKAKKEEENATLANAKAKQIENKERENSERRTAAEEKMIDQISNEYLQLGKALKDAETRYKNLYLVKGKDNEVTQAALQEAKGIRAVLDEIDQSLGNYQRNVGNYSSAFSNLRLQTTQLLRETPSLAINLNTFILALSNNLPLFFDAIQKAKAANADLAASGQKPVPIYKQLLQSIFSVQGLLTIGVTLLTVYAGKLIELGKELLGGTDKTLRLADAQKKFADETNKATDAIKNQVTSLKGDYQAALNADEFILGVQEKLGANQTRLFALKKAQAKDELELSKQQQSLAIQQAERETVNTTNRVKGLDALVAAQAYYNDQYKLAVNGQIDLINQTNRARLRGADVKSEDKLIEVNKDVIQSLKERLDVYTSVLQESFNADKKFSELTAEEEKYNADQRREIEVETAKIQANAVIAKNQIILNSDKSTLNQRLAAIKSNAEQQRKIALAELNNIVTDPTKAGTAEEIVARRKYSAEIKKINDSLQKDLFDTNEQYRLRNLEAEKQSFIQLQQVKAQQLRDLSQNQLFTLTERVSFEQAAFEAEKAIIDKEYQAQKEAVKNKFLTDQEKLAIETDYETKVLQLSKKTQDEITAILKSEIDRQQQLRQDDVDQIQRIYSQLALSGDNQYTEDVIALNESLKNKEISYNKYLKKRRELDYQAKVASIQNVIDEVEAELGVYKQAEAQFSAAEINLNDLKKRLSEARTDDEREKLTNEISVAQKSYDIAKTNVDKKIALEKKLNQEVKALSDDTATNDEENQRKRFGAIAQALTELSNLVAQINNFGSAISQRRLNAIEVEKDALEERYLREQDLIRATYTNQVDQQQKLAEAEARYNARKQQLLKEEKEEKIKQARFEKAASIASIILNTAAAVVKALPNIPLAVAAGVIGAAQLAVAVATPIPKYYKGKNVDAADDYEGYAWVDDGGKAEAIIRENGEVEIGTNKPRITYLSSKDIVLPDAKMLAWSATKTASQPPIFITTESSGLDKDQYMQGVKRIEKAVKGIKLNIRNQTPLDDWMRRL